MPEYNADRAISAKANSLLDRFSPSDQANSCEVSRLQEQHESIENGFDHLSKTPTANVRAGYFMSKHLGPPPVESPKQASTQDDETNGIFVTPKCGHRNIKRPFLDTLSDVTNLSKSPERMPLLAENPALGDLFKSEPTDSESVSLSYESIMPIVSTSEDNQRKNHFSFASNEYLVMSQTPDNSRDKDDRKLWFAWRYLQKATSGFVCQEIMEPATWIGAFMFLLFHNVYCLAIGAAIIRPHNPSPIVGQMTKMASLGVIVGSQIYWLKLSEIPALYPAVDLFFAPFLANIAAVVDDALFKDPNISKEENDEYFFATFGFLVSLSLVISGTLLMLASVFKLANVGAYLPFPVLCGFSTSVGVLTWTLAFKVDTNGKMIDEVLFSNDLRLIKNCLMHHIPSLFLGGCMKYLAPKNPFFVVSIVFAIVGLFYLIMFCFGISREQMVEQGWFWSSGDLHYKKTYEHTAYPLVSVFGPGAWLAGLIENKIHWAAVSRGLDTSIALGVLYLIRCSLHAAGLKKNVANLMRKESTASPSREMDDLNNETVQSAISGHRRKYSETLDVEHNATTQVGTKTVGDNNIVDISEMVAARPVTSTLQEMLYPYGLNQYICAIFGCFGVLPSIAATTTMYTLRADKIAPQILSIVLLSSFYLTDFNLIGYIPKAAFSSMLVLAFLDVVHVWGVRSFFKTHEKLEWLAVPSIVVLAFSVGLLQSVFVGIALSTFLFVAAFFRSGVVKYICNGINIRSTIERYPKITRWLDQNADQIQILVLQNYLFFGNATSIFSYITSMFDDAVPDVDASFIPPKPKVVIIDFTLVTGIDTSAVDVLSDILNQCKRNHCKLFLAGVSNLLREVMSLSGVKPEIRGQRSKRNLRFFSDLDAAVGKAEDILIDLEQLDEHLDPQYTNTGISGLSYALKIIDDEHGTSVHDDLIKLEDYAEVIDVDAGEILYRDRNMGRGLFFVEHGIMKIERNAAFTFSRNMGNPAFHQFAHHGTLNGVNFRSETIAKELALLKADGGNIPPIVPNSRIARVGPGWILGLIEVLSGTMHSRQMVAVTNCRLHYISYNKLSEIELIDPVLILKLYKLLAYLMAKRKENTIAQLGTLQKIMSSLAQKDPASRRSSTKSKVF